MNVLHASRTEDTYNDVSGTNRRAEVGPFIWPAATEPLFCKSDKIVLWELVPNPLVQGNLNCD